MTIKTEIINSIIDKEGGYVDDPSDSGGETNYGITKAVAIKSGYTDDMKSLTRKIAYDIYTNRYWDALNLTEISKISEIITRELADTGINMGVHRAGEFLQRCLNVLNNRQTYFSDIRVDGDIGGRTLQALTAYLQHRGNEGVNVLYKMLNSLQGAFYIELAERREKDERFIFGWFKVRIN